MSYRTKLSAISSLRRILRRLQFLLLIQPVQDLLYDDIGQSHVDRVQAQVHRGAELRVLLVIPVAEEFFAAAVS